MLFLATSCTALLTAQFSVAPEQRPTTHKFSLTGQAEVQKDRIRLTPADRMTTGAAWLREKQYVREGFTAKFTFQFSDQGGLGNGADGMAFVLQEDSPYLVGERGDGGGFQYPASAKTEPDIPPRYIAVFFDTFQNGQDPSGNYVAVHTSGPLPGRSWPATRMITKRTLNNADMKDGQPHTAVITFAPPLLTVVVDDGNPAFRSMIDVRLVCDQAGFAYVGLTASTGNGWEAHDVLQWEFTPAATPPKRTIARQERERMKLPKTCMTGRPLCTPQVSELEQTKPGWYHVILAPDPKAPALIPAAADQAIRIQARSGVICWAYHKEYFCRQAFDPRKDNGNAQVQPSAQEQRMGPLEIKRNGQGWIISSNTPFDKGYSRQQGYFEFDVEVYSPSEAQDTKPH